ncbi:proline-rich protein 36 isoform X2 [Rhipicephalus sanguineus]|uniref:proline-rich protein 36 isoform X2 n=1 Tax=Rhipicephalus sanguineus TaxID=34632 RepID=UPI00189442FC|nr:proline-rich protein 36 isoform X2 [Rhipicephalus sanguineus]
MNSVMEDVSSTFALDPQEEMRLLKDKVRQLELQNKQLRRSQQHLRSLSPCKTADSEKNSKDLKQSFNMSMSDEGNEKSSKESSLEDLGLIDVEFMSELDDETWLYEPPETGAGEATAALTSSARERVTAEPREPVNSARLSLSDKLDEITQWPSRTFDSRTFTRPRRRRPALDLEAMPTIAAVEAGSPRELPVRPAVQPASSPGVVSPSKEEASPSSPVPPVVPAQTLPRAPVNVHEIARLQEESLRLSSPISSPKRTSTTSARIAESSPDDSCLDDQQEVHQSRAQNAEGDARQRLRTPPLSLARTMENQSPSPGSSPYGSNSSLHQISQIPSKGATRRSLPNLSRVLNGLGTRNPSATGHQSKQQQPSLSHRNNLSQLPQPEIAGRSALPMSARTRSSSVVAAVPTPQSGPSSARTSQTGRRSLGLPQRVSHASPPSRMPPPARYMPAPPPAAPVAPMAAAATSVPQRSGLPRPSRIPPPRSQKRSGIPAFSRNAAMPSRFPEPDDDWSDGCY